MRNRQNKQNKENKQNRPLAALSIGMAFGFLLVSMLAGAITGTDIVSQVRSFVVDQTVPVVLVAVNLSVAGTFEKTVYTNDSIQCTIVANDSLSDITANITYWVNDTLRNDSGDYPLTHNVEYTDFGTLSGTAFFQKDNLVSCNITVWDAVNNTVFNASDSVNVSNYPPNQVNNSYPQFNDELYTNRTPMFNWTNETDIDEGDVIHYRLEIDTNNDFEDGIHSSFNDIADTKFYYNDTELSIDTTYWWRVQANDSENVSAWSEPTNFTVVSVVSMATIGNSVDFGIMNLNDVNDTESSENYPIVIENDGNVELNVSLNSTALWTSLTGVIDTEYYQYKANRSNISNSDDNNHTFVWSLSQTTYANMSATRALTFVRFNHSDGNDVATLDIRVRVPPDESPGAKEPAIILFIIDETT